MNNSHLRSGITSRHILVYLGQGWDRGRFPVPHCDSIYQFNDEKGDYMALIKCTECGKEISEKAASCPGCGCPINANEEIAPNVKDKKKKETSMCQAGLVFVVISFFIFPFLSIIGIILCGLDILFGGKNAKKSSSVVGVIAGIIALSIWVERVKITHEAIQEASEEYNQQIKEASDAYNKEMQKISDDYNREMQKMTDDINRQMNDINKMYR